MQLCVFVVVNVCVCVCVCECLLTATSTADARTERTPSPRGALLISQSVVTNVIRDKRWRERERDREREGGSKRGFGSAAWSDVTITKHCQKLLHMFTKTITTRQGPNRGTSKFEKTRYNAPIRAKQGFTQSDLHHTIDKGTAQSDAS